MRRWCPKCDKQLDYRTKEGYERAVKNNSCCSSCSRKKHPIEKLYTRFKRSARNRNKEFFLTIDYLMGLWHGQEKRCYLTGVDLDEENLSIDRIRNDLGYIPGNIRLCTKKVNISRHVLTIRDYIELSSKVTKYANIVNQEIC